MPEKLRSSRENSSTMHHQDLWQRLQNVHYWILLQGPTFPFWSRATVFILIIKMHYQMGLTGGDSSFLRTASASSSCLSPQNSLSDPHPFAFLILTCLSLSTTAFCLPCLWSRPAHTTRQFALLKGNWRGKIRISAWEHTPDYTWWDTLLQDPSSLFQTPEMKPNSLKSLEKVMAGSGEITEWGYAFIIVPTANIY